MANEEHLRILKQGVQVWNEWRQGDNLNVQPDLSEVNFAGANLAGGDFSGTDLHEATFVGTDFTGATLVETNFSEAVLYGANFTGANFAKAEFHRSGLSDAILTGADLTEAGFTGANLYAADLTGANLAEVDFAEANFHRACLVGAKLTGANLVGVGLSHSDLTGANLLGADLHGASLDQARIHETIFGNTNLHKVRRLHRCHHTGPSTIDLRTIRKSWPLPMPFLRGCGLDDTFIDYTVYERSLCVAGLVEMPEGSRSGAARCAATEGEHVECTPNPRNWYYLPSLIGEPVQFYSCFISYSSENQDFAERLHTDLQNQGVRCWFAPEDLRIGDRTRYAVDKAIRVRDKLLIVFSEAAIGSTWVETEVETAFEEERERDRTVLFPIRIDETVMKTKRPWARQIRSTRHIGNFQDWKNHDAYQKALRRLLRDLKTDE